MSGRPVTSDEDLLAELRVLLAHLVEITEPTPSLATAKLISASPHISATSQSYAAADVHTPLDKPRDPTPPASHSPLAELRALLASLVEITDFKPTPSLDMAKLVSATSQSSTAADVGAHRPARWPPNRRRSSTQPPSRPPAARLTTISVLA